MENRRGTSPAVDSSRFAPPPRHHPPNIVPPPRWHVGPRPRRRQPCYSRWQAVLGRMPRGRTRARPGWAEIPPGPN
jgi:hypothetical protein